MHLSPDKLRQAPKSDSSANVLQNLCFMHLSQPTSQKCNGMALQVAHASRCQMMKCTHAYIENDSNIENDSRHAKQWLKISNSVQCTVSLSSLVSRSAKPFLQATSNHVALTHLSSTASLAHACLASDMPTWEQPTCNSR